MPGLTTRVDALGHNLVLMTGVATTTTSGTLSTTTGANDCEGFTLARTAAGRYVATIAEKYGSIQYADMVVEGHATDAAAAAKGVVNKLRAVSASGKSVTFQLVTPALAAGAEVDVDPEDAAVLRILIVASTRNL
jgi:hypothetical protein